MNTEVTDMVVIDGSKGEGGGQIFRTSLTLAMCLGRINWYCRWRWEAAGVIARSSPARIC